MIEALGLEKRYPGFHLRVPRLRVRPGEVLTVVGPSGAGKSTLLRLLAGLEPPDQGRVIREGLAVYLDQEPYVLERSVLENAAFGLRLQGVPGVEARRRARDWLDRVGLLPLADRPARVLSGGERVRLALARALAVEPRALLLDEPTANLDPGNVARIEALLAKERSAGRVLVLVTHNLFQARRLADRVLFLLAGEAVECALAPVFFDSPKDPRTRAFLSGTMVW